MQGKFITFEGSDAAGKTTNIGILAEFLRSIGHTVVTTREPGGTELSETLRHLLLTVKMCPMAELLLFAGARAEHLNQLVKPALASGHVVLCDRFSDSTYAYQGHGRGYMKEVLELEKFVQGDFQPDHTLFFDLTLEESAKRLSLRTDKVQDNFDKEREIFRKAVYDGYQERFRDNPHRMVRIDAMPGPEKVSAQIISWATRVSFVKEE